MKRVHLAGICVAAFFLPLLTQGEAAAQNGTGGGPATAPGAAAPQGGGGGGGAPAGGTTTQTFYPGGVAPTAPGEVTGGGNTKGSSSSQPGQDHFDLGQSSGGGGTVHGNENGSFQLPADTGAVRMGDTSMHTVRRGDTLWGICDSYFKNPYQWPRIWSYNPQIQNPHWIYPGDQVRLRGGNVVTQQPTETAQVPGQSFVDRRRQVVPETIFLRNDGYIEDEKSATWGEITGSREDKMFLDDYDEVYIRIAEGHEVKLGQELTVFRPLRSAGSGKLVQIQGTIKIDEWNGQERIARGRIIETEDVIERGAFVGPITRKYEVVPPKRNDQDLNATILTSVQSHVFYGQNQVVFLDRGEQDGLRPGNRLFVIRKGDAWHQTLPASSTAQRIAIERDDPAATESVPRPRDESKLPEETYAEIRVITTREHSSMALVTNATREIEQGDTAVARKGY